MRVTNDPEEIKKAEQEKALDDLEKLAALKVLLEMRGGRKWIYDMMRDYFVWSSPMTGNSQTYHNLGLQLAGQQLMNDVERVDPLMASKLKHEFTKELTNG